MSGPVTELLSGLAIVTVIVYGGYQVINGERTAGALFSFITAFLLAYEPMKRMAKLNGQLQGGLAAADRVFALLDIKPSIVDKPGAGDWMWPATTSGSRMFSSATAVSSRRSTASLWRCRTAIPWRWSVPPGPANRRC